MKSVLNRSVWSQSNFSYSQSIGAWYCGRVFAAYQFLSGFLIFSKDGFYSKRIRLIRNETSRRSLLPSFENFYSSLALQTIFRMPSMPFRIFGIFIFFQNAKVAKNIWHFYFFKKCQNCPLILAWHFYFKMPCHNFLDGINKY